MVNCGLTVVNEITTGLNEFAMMEIEGREIEGAMKNKGERE